MSEAKETETKTENFNNIEALKDQVTLKANKARKYLNEHQAFLMSSFGAMPKTEIELVEFIQKVLTYEGLKKDD